MGGGTHSRRTTLSGTTMSLPSRTLPSSCSPQRIPLIANCARRIGATALSHAEVLWRDSARAAWWTYKHYADSVPMRVQSTSSDVRIVSFASRGGDDAQAGSARLLIGYYAYQKSPPSVEVRLRLQNV